MTDDIGEKLRKLRVLRGYSQEYVAEKIEVSLSSYQRYENSKSGIDFHLMVKIADLYKMTLDNLYHYGESENEDIEDSMQLYRQMQKRVDVLVRLDGSDSTLDNWFQKLAAINKVL